MYFSDFHHASKKLQLKPSEMYFVLLQYGAKVLQLIDFDKVHESVGAFRRKWMTFRLEKKRSQSPFDSTDFIFCQFPLGAVPKFKQVFEKSLDSSNNAVLLTKLICLPCYEE